MPHIVSLNEKRELCSIMPVRAIRVPDKFLDRTKPIEELIWSQITESDKTTIFKLIEDIIADTLPTQMNSEYFRDFVNIKEVPTWET